MNELTQNNFVVVTRATGKHYINSERAQKLVELMNSNDCPKLVKINETFVSVGDIAGITPAYQYEIAQREKNGEWLCASKNWHSKYEKCKCNWGKSDNRKLKDDDDMTPEQRERSQIISAMRDRGLGYKDFIKLKGKTNDQLKDMLSRM